MTTPVRYTFGAYQLIRDQRQLQDIDGQPVKLGSRAFDMLLVLVERRDRTVSKHELMDLVWPKLVVEENNLQVHMVALRKLLGHPAIATIPGRGYRFTLPVKVDGAAAVAAASPAASPAAEAAAEAAAEPALPAAPAAPAAPRRSNLPEQPPQLFSREAELAQLQLLLAEQSVVTVAGAGGIGKTCLAQAAGCARLRSGSGPVWWVELAALSSPEALPATVASVLGLQASDSRTALQALAAALRAEPALIILDNAEHLLESVATLVQTLRAEAPPCRWLITSQEVLRLHDEHVLRLSTLDQPADGSLAAARASGAVALFVARAHAADPHFRLNDGNVAAVVEICRQLDGIPLAIEMAASRVRLLGIEGLRQRLGERFKVLTAGSRAVLRRHQTLRATLDWSHGLLSEPEQRVFRRLGVFVGGFTLEAAQRLADDETLDSWDVLEHLGGLVDKSLVLVDDRDPPRYRMLETTRLFALEQLGQAGETEPLMRRHAEVMVALLGRNNDDAQRHRTGLAQRDFLAVELSNARAALAWAAGCEDDVLAIEVAACAHYAYKAGDANPEYFARAWPMRLRISAAVPAATQAHLWLELATACRATARPEGLEAGQRAAQLYRELGDHRRCFEALVWAIAIGSRRGPSVPIEPLIDEAGRLLDESWPYVLHSAFHWACHRWRKRQGRWEEALAHAWQQVEACRRDPNRKIFGVNLALGNVADCEISLGRLDEAAARLEGAAQVMLAQGVAVDVTGFVLDTLMVAQALQGRLDEALSTARLARPMLEREGDDLRLLEPLALVAARLGRADDAAQVAGHVDAEMMRMGEERWPAQQARRAQLDELLALALPPSRLQQLRAAGALMSREQAFASAFGDTCA